MGNSGPDWTTTIWWSKQDEAFVAVASKFPGLSGIGETEQDALNALYEAIEMATEEDNYA